MKRAEDYLKENNRIESLKRSIELNDLHSIYSIMEDFVDAEIEAKKNESLHNVSQQRELLIAFDTMREFDIKHDDIEESVDYFLKNKESYL